MTPALLSSILNRNAESVCKHLLPKGRRKGSEWVCGDLSGEEGESLKIAIEGDKTGVGSDFATGQGFGDLLDVWCAVQSVGLAEAMAQACSYLGIVDDSKSSRPSKDYAKPNRPHTVKRLSVEGKVYAYLKLRGLTDSCLEDFRIAEDGDWMVFPSLRNGELVNIKYIHIDRIDGKKQVRQEKGAEPCLFGWQALDLRFPTSRYVCLTEGQIDAATLHQCGLPALSVPNGGGGGGKQDWIETEYDRLSRFDTLYLCLDNDEAGQQATKEIIHRMGPERCRIVTLPFKDANECFTNGIKNFQRYLLSSKVLDPEELKPADTFLDAVMDKFYPTQGSYCGMKPPFKKLSQNLLFRKPELILWTGYTSSGKALSLDTPIPTPDGWSKMGDLKVGDSVFDENGNPCKVVALSEIMNNRPCYKVLFSDGCEIIADENHEWIADTVISRRSDYNARKNGRDIERPLNKRGNDQRSKRTFKSIVTTKRISQTLVVYEGKNTIRGKYNYSIPIAGALNLPFNDSLPIEPYVLGLWLGDGHSTGCGFTTSDPELLDSFVNSGIKILANNGRYGYNLSMFTKVVKKYNLYKNKHIPDDYLRSSYEQRLSLMQGLMDTDGYTGNSSCEFCSTNKTLAYQVLELARTLGIRAYMCLGRATLYSKDCGEKYRVMFTTNIPVFRLKRKLDRLKTTIPMKSRSRMIVGCEQTTSVPVRCIQVDSDSHLYLAGESMIATHNSIMLNQVMAQGLTDGEKFACASMEMPSKVTLWRMIRQLTGDEYPTQERVQQGMKWLRDKLWMIDILKTANPEKILSIFQYAYRRYGITNFILDSLLKCGVDEKDIDAQKNFINQLIDFVNITNSTIHLVAHMRKGENMFTPGGLADVRGAAAITDLAHTVISVWRNRSEGDEVPSYKKKKVDPNNLPPEYDTLLKVEKQRETGWEGKAFLSFDTGSLQFREERSSIPIDYLNQVKAVREVESTF